MRVRNTPKTPAARGHVFEPGVFLLERREHAHDIQIALVVVHAALETTGPAIVDDDADGAGAFDGSPVVARVERVYQQCDTDHARQDVLPEISFPHAILPLTIRCVTGRRRPRSV